jgi:hypothetical protein
VSEFDPFSDRLLNSDGTLSEPWFWFLHELNANIDAGSRVRYISSDDASSGDIIDKIISKGNRGVVYCYTASDGTNTRMGIMGTGWNADGVLVSDHMQMDAVEAGDTSDLFFTFAKSGTNTHLTITSTNTYSFRAIRLVL